MKTLYDVLDLRANDDAARVKEAFRKAVKVNHPDLNADDPDAAARFREMVLAKTILSDPELRALYDRMLDFERQQLHPPSTPAVTLDAKHIVVLAAVLAGAFTLITYLAETPVANVKVVEHAAHEPSNVVDVQPPPPTDAPDQSEQAKASVPSAVAPTTSSAVAVEEAAPALTDAQPTTTDVIAAIHADGLTSSLPAKDARFYRAQGIAAYRQGDVSLAIADFNRAIRLDRNLQDAYIDRSLAFYRVSEFNRAFADIAQAMRIKTSNRMAPRPLSKASSVIK